MWKRSGRYKTHWVLRGDHQTFDEPDLDDEDEEDESDDAASGDDKAEDTHGFATTPRSTDPPLPEHMVNTAVSVGRGIGIRAGSGDCPPVSHGSKTFVTEHLSASEKSLLSNRLPMSQMATRLRTTVRYERLPMPILSLMLSTLRLLDWARK